MKKIILVCSLALALSACADHTQSKISEPTLSMLTSAPAWINNTKTNIVTAPMADIVDGNTTFTATNFCKPHDCASDFMIRISNPQTKQEYSLVVHVKDTDAAILTPSKYASYLYLGNPSEHIKSLLQQVLKQNPNWK
ncbi:Ivy family c-type lysozyme inhibitor [Shewanella marina]|uniref:Ivy family c-type lysozyme inhibitor n=1 Tax=Shewanella marina TaxID=487319 RepID=UPI00046E71FF|nr:Ivy family c-type lysozyme inhibitor [Shewanella marina]